MAFLFVIDNILVSLL